MKQFLIVFPKSKANEFAAYAYANEIRVMLSWLKEEEFFSLSSNASGMHAICICKEETATALMATEWKNFVQK